MNDETTIEELRKAYHVDNVSKFLDHLEDLIEEDEFTLNVTVSYCKDTVQGLLLMAILLSKNLTEPDNLCDFIKAAWEVTPGLTAEIKDDSDGSGNDDGTIH